MKAKHHQNRFLRIVTLPIRALGKARDFYVKGLMECSNGVGYGNLVGIPTPQSTTLPRSFSALSARSTDDEDFRELIRAASARSSKIDVNLIMQEQMRKSNAFVAGANSKGVPRSCSVGMGRIDEDTPCVFGDVNVSSTKKMKTELIYPRSRSYAVTKRRAVY